MLATLWLYVKKNLASIPLLLHHRGSLSSNFQIPFRFLADTFQTPFRHLSDPSQIPFSYLSATFQIPFRYLSDTFQIPFRYLSDTFQISFWHLSDTFMTPFWHLSDTFQVPFRSRQIKAIQFILMKQKKTKEYTFTRQNIGLCLMIKEDYRLRYCKY